MNKTKGISPKLAAAIAPPLIAVVTAMILTATVDRQSLAALAAILIGAALGYHAPAGEQKLPSVAIQPVTFTASTGSALWTPSVQPTMGPSGKDMTTPGEFDGDDDGDDVLPVELDDRIPDADPPPDEINQPDEKGGAA